METTEQHSKVHSFKIKAKKHVPNTVSIDFETFYVASGANKYSVSDTNAYSYCKDPRFDCYCVSYYDGETAIVCHPSIFDWSLLTGKIVISHNANFDYAVYAIGLKAPGGHRYKEWLCSSAASSYLGLPRSLKDSCNAVLGRVLSKDVREQASGKNDLGEDMVLYAADDAINCYDLWAVIGEYWTLNERLFWNHGVEVGLRGVPTNPVWVSESIEKLLIEKERIEKLIPYEKKLSVKQLRESCIELGVEPPSTTNKNSLEFHIWLEDYGSLVPHMSLISEYRSVSLTIKKLCSIQESIYLDEEGVWKFPFSLTYFGGHTGRFSGKGGGFNMQNLPRDPVHGVLLRNLIQAPPGYKLLVVDYSQVEVRVFHYLCQDWDMISKIRESSDIYEVFARQFGLYTDSRPLKEVDHELRHTVKGVVLGCMFMLGPHGFMNQCNRGKKPGDKLMDLETATKFVQMYRASLPSATKFWASLKNELNKAKWKVGTRDRYLSYKLPSGRKLFYRGLKPRRMKVVNKETGEESWKIMDTYKEGFLPKKIHQGTLANNVTQATARDVLRDATVELERRGLNILLTVHDECIIMFKEEDQEKTEKIVNEVMTVPPAWAKELPLEIEYNILDRYSK